MTRRRGSRYVGVRWNGYSWEARWPDAAGHRRQQAGFSTAKTAADFRTAKLAAVRVEKLRRRHLPDFVDELNESITVPELFETYLLDRKAANPLSAATEAKYRTYYQTKIAPAFQNIPPASITADAILRWQVELVVSAATDTARTARRILAGILEIGRKRGLLAANPIHDVPKISSTSHDLQKIARPDQRVLSDTEGASLAEAIDERYRGVALVGLIAGLRPAEIYALRLNDMSIDDGIGWISVRRQLVVVMGAPQLTTRLKGEPRSSASRRDVPVARALIAELRAAAAMFETGPNGELFLSPEGRRFDPTNFRRRIWHQAVRDAGLIVEGLRIPVPYTLRRTHSSQLLHAGIAPAVVAKRLGHADQRTTLRHYSTPVPGAELAVVDVLRPSVGGILGAGSQAEVIPLDARTFRNR